jgi:hypothetical protein
VTIVTILIGLVTFGTFAFGAVYPWGFIPLLGAAAAVGVTGLCRCGLRTSLRPLAFGLFFVCAAGTVQLVPLPPALLASISPATPDVLAAYDLAYAGGEVWSPLSIRPHFDRFRRRWRGLPFRSRSWASTSASTITA